MGPISKKDLRKLRQKNAGAIRQEALFSEEKSFRCFLPQDGEGEYDINKVVHYANSKGISWYNLIRDSSWS